ncbi:hypothetical protein F53441_8545 [Fusarium austroafricanum]|uniref:Uncharacterized protein n=1 Tax=Fusarium austroafricanum TaxID=2364996 RepID=A0A8H4KB62_9HYPO|nr:hypothetical protein F53441_8545 [Fusarium austroafricanum]
MASSTATETTAVSLDVTTTTILSTTEASSTTDLASIVTETSTASQDGTATSSTNAAPSTTQPLPPIDIECSTDQDCIAALGAGAVGIYACIDLICQQTAS